MLDQQNPGLSQHVQEAIIPRRPWTRLAKASWGLAHPTALISTLPTWGVSIRSETCSSGSRSSCMRRPGRDKVRVPCPPEQVGTLNVINNYDYANCGPSRNLPTALARASETLANSAAVRFTSWTVAESWWVAAAF